MAQTSGSPETLRELVDSASRILVISHISPDPDAICSMLLTATALKQNYPSKTVCMNSEELTGGLQMLDGYEDITMLPLDQAITERDPDLIIITDAMNFQRCTRANAAPVAQLVKDKHVKLAIIDHHEPDGVEDNNLYINRQAASATEEVYRVLFKELALSRPAGYATTALLGIISDTNRFMYDNPGHKATFDVVDELLDAGASIERLENLRTRYSKNLMMVLAELAANCVIEKEYSYSFISDEFKTEWAAADKSADELKLGCHIFVNDYIRNLGDNLWGFMVYPDLAGGPDLYSSSLRSTSGVIDVAEIAKRLGGGGHKSSAGAKFICGSVGEAVDKVKQAITQG